MARWLSLSEAEQLSGYSRHHLLKLIRLGKLRAKPLDLYLVSEKNLTRYIDRQKASGKRRGPKSKLPIDTEK